jgi:hypothetical protein
MVHLGAFLPLTCNDSLFVFRRVNKKGNWIVLGRGSKRGNVTLSRPPRSLAKPAARTFRKASMIDVLPTPESPTSKWKPSVETLKGVLAADPGPTPKIANRFETDPGPSSKPSICFAADPGLSAETSR